MNVANVQAYLKRYGYLESDAVEEFGFGRYKSFILGEPLPNSLDDVTRAALMEYQRHNGLPVTGEPDEATEWLMSEPRCGFPDVGSFVLHGNKWTMKHLTYGFVEETRDVPNTRALMRKAFDLWEQACGLTFTEEHSGLPDIVIRFVTGDHGDGFAFDGAGKTLAHAFFPPPNGGHLAGDCHFDDAERWTDGDGGVDLVTVGAHEIGHAIGLAHSQTQGALMWPYYTGPRPVHADDVAGARELYGAPAKPTPRPEPEPPKEPDPPDVPGTPITPDGWVKFAQRMPGRANKVNPGVNGVKGIFLHSAEGYAPHLLDLAVNGPLSWHFSLLKDGTLIQHYPLSARCWHATAANQEYIGVENEGKHDTEPSLTDAQISTNIRLIRVVSEWKGWKPTRPRSGTDTSHTLWEHNEVVRIGGSPTACPSGRIPWQRIMGGLGDAPPALPSVEQAAHALGFAYPAFWAKNRELVHPFDRSVIARVSDWLDGG